MAGEELDPLFTPDAVVTPADTLNKLAAVYFKGFLVSYSQYAPGISAPSFMTVGTEPAQGEYYYNHKNGEWVK